MHTKLLLLCLVVVVAVTEARTGISSEHVSDAERAEIMKEAISEAKFSAQLQTQAEEMDKKIKKPITADFLLRRGFKRPTELALKQGKARLMVEDMVHRAERKMEEKRRQNEAKTASLETQAEHLAEELYHTPGSLLKSEEIAQIYSEVEESCIDVRSTQTCPSEAQDPTINTFRRIDGTCNNLDRPTLGASDTGFRRIIDSLVYENGISSLRGQSQFLDPKKSFSPPFPSARLLSQRIVRDIVQFETPFTHLLMQFGQFLDHDLDLGPEFEVECEGCEITEFCAPIRVEKDDPVFGKGTLRDGTCTPLRRSIPTCEPRETVSTFPAREQINVLTSFIDGSMIYGSNERQQKAVRDTNNNGLLKVRQKKPGEQFEALPIDTDELVACLNTEGCFLCGDVRCNEQASLTIMHTLWLRAHNKIARSLKDLNDGWDDDRLYEEARKIVGAIIQKIVYYDYLPKIMGKGFDITIGKYDGYKNDSDPSVPNAFATAAYRYGHSLVLPKFSRLDPDYNPAGDPIELVQLFFNPDIYDQTGEGNQIVRGWISEAPRRADEFVNSFLTNSLFQTPREVKGGGLDLAALNIQRGRDHGLPVYGYWRDFCAREFPGLGRGTLENWLTYVRFKDHHGFVDFADLWAAGLSETRVEGALIGPTFSCIFGDTFRDVRDGDRFYFESQARPDRPDSITVFTPIQLQQIRDTTFSTIICDNTDTTEIQPDAFLICPDRRSCTEEIPKLDLLAWREDVSGEFTPTCFLPVQNVWNRAIRLQLQIVGSDIPDIIDEHFPKNTPSDSISGRQCLPTFCPTQGATFTLFAFTLNTEMGQERCSAIPSVPDEDTLFSIDVTESDIGNSIFSTLADCQEAKSPTVAFDCREKSAHVAAAADTSGTSQYYDSIADLDKFLKSRKASVAHHDKMTSSKKDPLEQDLEELLKKLNN